MRALLLEVTEADLRLRRETGLDRFDEMWEGVLHMASAPTHEHQRITADLLVFLRPLLDRSGRGTIVRGVNVFNQAAEKPDYRIPDLTFVAAGRERLVHEDGIRGGGPDAVVEVRSPDDESYDKLPFYARLGLREVIAIDRDSKRTEVFRLAGAAHVLVSADGDGWVASEALGARFRARAAGRPTLEVEDVRDPAARATI